uniref:Uncharacterized protein n=1 Tax=Arundo donax TaxID=35708 RepID=A0A0A9BHL3_ARUDO
MTNETDIDVLSDDATKQNY